MPPNQLLCRTTNITEEVTRRRVWTFFYLVYTSAGWPTVWRVERLASFSEDVDVGLEIGRPGSPEWICLIRWASGWPLD